MGEYEWTEADVLDAKRRAALKQMEYRASCVEANEIEEAFWEKKLTDRFPDLKYKTHDEYLALISFSDGDEWCMCKGPVRCQYMGVEMRVWHKGSKGKFRKLADRYECRHIVPFVKEVRVAQSQEAIA